MNASREAPSVHNQALDWLFARLAGNAPDPIEEAAPPPEAPAAPRADLAAEMPPPPPIESPADLQAATLWLQKERQRLEAYTRAQLGRVQQEHQAVLQQNYLNEQTLIMRSQELARREEMLQTQGQAFQSQAEEISRREQALAGQLQQWWQANEQLAVLEEVNAVAQQDAAQHHAVVQALQAETVALQQAREAARGELNNLLQAGKEQQEARAREEAGLGDRKAQLERRLYTAEKAALSADQRQAEIDDLEMRLRREIDDQERELRRRRQDLEARERELRQSHTTEQARARALHLQLEQRMATLDRNEAALGQRQAELEELHEHLEQAQAELLRQFENLELRDHDLSVREQPLREAQEPVEAFGHGEFPAEEWRRPATGPRPRRLRS